MILLLIVLHSSYMLYSLAPQYVMYGSQKYLAQVSSRFRSKGRSTAGIAAVPPGAPKQAASIAGWCFRRCHGRGEGGLVDLCSGTVSLFRLSQCPPRDWQMHPRVSEGV